MKIINNKFLKLSLISIFLIVFFINNFITARNVEITKLEENANNLSNLIQDEIEPYCNGVSYDDNKSLKIKNLNYIDINFSNKASWYQNLFGAYKSQSDFIFDEFKKEYNAEIIFYFTSDIICKSKAEVRISGDFKDHINMSNLSTSLDVKLKNGNIENITKFKLFLPNTKRGDVELINSTIMRKLGFLVPRSNYVNVSVNNQQKIKYILQEKTVKEFVEFNKKRESALIETSEEFYWQNRIKIDQDNIFLLLYGKILNNDWVNKTESNKYVGIEAVDKYNFILLNSPASFLNYDYKNSAYEKLLEFDVAMYALDSLHGLAPHNRKFYFDNIENKLYPIYYDADSQIALRNKDILNCDASKVGNESILNYSCKNNFAAGAESLLQNINFDVKELKSIINDEFVEIDNSLVEDIYNKFLLNIQDISKIGNYELNKEIDPIEKLKFNISNLSDNQQIGFYFYDIENSYLEICNFKLTECSYSEIKDFLIEDSILIDDKEYYFLGNSKIQQRNSAMLFNDMLLEHNSYLRVLGDKNYTVSITNKNLSITLNNNQKVLIFGQGFLENWNISLINNSEYITNQDRQDKDSLTGCLTIYGVQLKNVEIRTYNNFCEDSVNLLNVSGHINQINVENSQFDAVDIDFSNIEIDDINILNSNNDCLDISYSNVFIQSINVTNCEDKSLSLGENSFVQINNFLSTNSNIGVGIKDSSTAQIENFSGYQNNLCIAMYRKKQEFGPSALTINNYSCQGKFENFIQTGQKFEK